MGGLTPKQVISRAGKAQTTKLQWQSVLEDADEFSLPQRNAYTKQAKGALKMDRVFDSTAILSRQKFASRIQTDMTPPFQKWADLAPGPLVPEGAKEQISSILQQARDRFFVALHTSSFDTAIAEYYMDLAAGTAAMLFLEGDDNEIFKFICVPMAQIAIDEGPMGSVDGVFRTHNMKIRNIKGTWKNATIPQVMGDMVGKDSEVEVELTEATYFDAAEDKYYYQVLFKGNLKNSAEAVVIVEQTYDEHPWLITRWIKAPGEVMGRGPVLFALPDIKTLNKVKEFLLKNASLAIAGVWSAVDDGVINPNVIRIVPGAVIPVGADGNLKRLDVGGDVNLAQFVIEELQKNIRHALFDRSLPSETGAVRSPTEIIERVKELQEDTGAPFGRMVSELIRPLMNRGLGIMNRKGIIEFPIKVNGLFVDVTVTSPLARMQKLNDVETAVRWLSLAQSVGQEVFFLGVKVEDFPAWLADKLGVDRVLVRDKGERDQMQKQVAQIIAIQQQAQAGIPTGQPANQGIPLAA